MKLLPIIAVVIALGLGVNWLVGSAASQGNAENALRVQGFDHIHLITRHRFLVELQGCGKEDVAKFDFTAQNARGITVHVSVCEGWPFKGATVRST